MRRITVCVLADGCCCCYNCAGSGTCANYLAVEIVSFCVEGVVAMVITTAGDMFRPLSFFFFLPSSSFTTQEKSSVEVGFRFFSILGIQHPSTRTGFRLLLSPVKIPGFSWPVSIDGENPSEEEESRRRHLPCRRKWEKTITDELVAGTLIDRQDSPYLYFTIQDGGGEVLKGIQGKKGPYTTPGGKQQPKMVVKHPNLVGGGFICLIENMKTNKEKKKRKCFGCLDEPS
jgi:hypothetical protein